MLKALVLAAVLASTASLAQEATLKFDRSAVIKLHKDGTTVKDLGAHNDNPFASREACVEGLVKDTATIYEWLAQQGLDVSEFDVDVTCSPAGKPA